jgi:hypothetical protein
MSDAMACSLGPNKPTNKELGLIGIYFLWKVMKQKREISMGSPFTKISPIYWGLRTIVLLPLNTTELDTDKKGG